jgi:nitrogen fixation protein FixH
MTLNWGKSIVLAIALFMSFILYFVIKVQSNSKYDNEMVVDQYYQKELRFEGDYLKLQNAKNLPKDIVIESDNNNYRLVFPEGFAYSSISGKVFLYRPSSQELDFEIPISLSGPYLLIPKSNLADGRWDITIDWQHNGVSYLSKLSL